MVVLILAGILLKNIFSGSAKAPFDPKIYNYKLKPIKFPQKEFPVYIQDNNDIAIKFARIWKLTEIYNKTSESCLETFADQHPNNLVQKQNLTSLYGIEIGTDDWYELTDTFEIYATEVCYSYSSHEIEKIYTKGLKEKLAKKELTEVFEFYNTEIGKKYVAANEFANNNIQKFIAQKQRDAVNKEVEIYNKKIEELQKRNH